MVLMIAVQMHTNQKLVLHQSTYSMQCVMHCPSSLITLQFKSHMHQVVISIENNNNNYEQQ